MVPDTMRRIAALVLAFAPAFALAQTAASLTQINFTYGGASEHRFRDTACTGTGSSLQVTWTVPALVNPATLCTALKVWLTSTSCGDDPKGNDVSLNSISQTELVARTGYLTVSLADLPIFATSSADAGTDAVCGTLGTERTAQVCGSAKSGGCTGLGVQSVLQAAPLKLIYDTEKPAAPTLDSLEVQDSIIIARYTASSGTTTLYGQASAAGAGAFSTTATDTALSGKVKLSGLTNNQTYEVRLIPVDAAGNEGPASNVLSATPLKSYGFWSNYRQSGGADQGGCSAATGLVPALAGLFIVLMSSRRKRP
jgi:hypothetical protein